MPTPLPVIVATALSCIRKVVAIHVCHSGTFHCQTYGRSATLPAIKGYDAMYGKHPTIRTSVPYKYVSIST